MRSKCFLFRQRNFSELNLCSPFSTNELTFQCQNTSRNKLIWSVLWYPRCTTQNTHTFVQHRRHNLTRIAFIDVTKILNHDLIPYLIPKLVVLKIEKTPCIQVYSTSIHQYVWKVYIAIQKLLKSASFLFNHTRLRFSSDNILSNSNFVRVTASLLA